MVEIDKCQFKSLKGTNYVISLEHPLGKGSYGSVYLAYDKKNNRHMAAKQIDISVLDSMTQKQVTNEIVNMRKINNQHVARLYDVFQGTKHLYLFIEYCNGGSLDEYLSQKGGRLSESEAISFMKQLLDGYNSLYKNNLAHRDIKPANVILHDGKAKLTDFGFSKAVDDLKVANFQTRVGTPLYMSPQILEGDEYSYKTDVWSFGVLFFKMLYGREPWSAKSEAELVKKISTSEVTFPDQPPVTPVTKTLVSEMLKFNESERIGFESLFDRIHSKISPSENSLSQSQSSLRVDKLLEVYENMKKNFENRTVIRSPYEGINQKNSAEELDNLIPLNDLEKKESTYHNDEQMRKLFLQQAAEKELNKKIRIIGFWVVSKLNKISLIASTITLFYEVNTDLKVLEAKQAYKFLFILVKFYMISAMKLQKWLSVSKEEFQQNLISNENKLVKLFRKDVMYFVDSPLKQNMDGYLERDIDVGKKFFNKILELFEPQFKNLSPEEKKKREVSSLILICKKDFKRSEVFNELKKESLLQNLQIFDNFYKNQSKGFLEEYRNFFVLRYHIWVLSDLKKNLNVKSVDELDFNKYFDFLNTAQVNRIAEKNLPW